MKDIFVSYSHRDREPVSRIAGGFETTGYEVWWDRRLQANQDFGREIEAALRNANCAVVAWSRTARDSLWVRAEANEALESGKLVQLSLDGARPPLPFTMIHLLDFSHWSGRTADPPWKDLHGSVEAVISGETPATADPGTRAARLAGFGPTVVTGAASLALVGAAAGIVGLGASGAFSTSAFGLISGGMFLAALLAFTQLLTRIIKVALASR